MDAIRTSREQLLVLEEEAATLVNGGDVDDARLVELPGEEILEQAAATSLVGTLGVRVIAVICSAERGSHAWVRFMARLINIDDTQEENDATFAPAVQPRPLPVCHLTLCMGTRNTDDDTAVANHAAPVNAGALHKTYRRMQSGEVRTPGDDGANVDFNRSDAPDLNAQNSLMLCWQTEEQFELRPLVLAGCDARTVRVDIEDIGAADLDLSK